MNTIDKVIYTARTHTTGGSDGNVRSDDGRLLLQLSPPEVPGIGTNPWQLLGAGWSACFLGALGHFAKLRDLALPEDAAIDAEVDLCAATGGFVVQARLRVTLPGIDLETARALVNAAHAASPYSKATNGNIAVSIDLA
ncbi:Ohr family peroxiredoxin [Pendulispora brunnea]|uniref:Ohr family peroxiredoxin n=1 Tax=Pendulispora brunnea TaxID=2905690 RepID=A0ABZ2K287_9BACT